MEEISSSAGLVQARAVAAWTWALVPYHLHAHGKRDDGKRDAGRL